MKRFKIKQISYSLNYSSLDFQSFNLPKRDRDWDYIFSGKTVASALRKAYFSMFGRQEDGMILIPVDEFNNNLGLFRVYCKRGKIFVENYKYTDQNKIDIRKKISDLV